MRMKRSEWSGAFGAGDDVWFSKYARWDGVLILRYDGGTGPHRANEMAIDRFNYKRQSHAAPAHLCVPHAM